MGRGVGGRFRMGGTRVSLWLIHVDMWEKPSQYYKIISSNLNKQINNVPVTQLWM